jgi:hypothetical protein
MGVFVTRAIHSFQYWQLKYCRLGIEGVVWLSALCVDDGVSTTGTIRPFAAAWPWATASIEVARLAVHSCKSALCERLCCVVDMQQACMSLGR